MEELCQRFPLIAQKILNHVDNETLTNFKEIGRNIDDFLTEEIDGSSIKKIVGNKSVMKMDSEGVNINLYKIPKDKSLKLVLDPEYIYSYFLIKGEIEIDKDVISKGDFFKVSKENNLLLSSKEKSDLFEIKSPIKIE